MFSLGKIVTFVQDDRGTSLISREDKDIGIGGQGAESRMFRGAEVRLLWKSGGEFGVGSVGKDVAFLGESGGLASLGGLN